MLITYIFKKSNHIDYFKMKFKNCAGRPPLDNEIELYLTLDHYYGKKYARNLLLYVTKYKIPTKNFLFKTEYHNNTHLYYVDGNKLIRIK